MEQATIQPSVTDYYTRKYIQYLLIENTKHRDFSALGKNNANIRAIYVNCLYDLERALKVIGWERNRQNLYVSCAKLRFIPQFTFNPKERSSQTIEWYRSQYEKDVLSYDLFFDWDLKEGYTWKDLLKEAEIFKEYLDEYQIKYTIAFSGSKGIHIVIDGRLLDIEEIKNGAVYPHKTVVETIKKALGFELLDLSNNSIANRLRKLYYSLVDDRVVLPLSDDDFNNFDLKKFNVEYVLSNVKLIRRGNLERFWHLSDEEAKVNLNKFLKIFSFKQDG